MVVSPPITLRQPVNVIGDDISLLETEIGTQVTATVEEVPDLHALTMILLVPQFNLDAGPTPRKIRNQGFGKGPAT